MERSQAMNADTIHWSGKGQMYFTAFSIGVTQLLAHAGALDPKNNDASSPVVKQAIADFNDTSNLNDYQDASAALVGFEEWLPTWVGLATYVKKIENGAIRVSITMPGKSGASVTIELAEEMVEGATQYVVNKTVLKLSDMARNAYLSLIDVRGAFGVQPSQQEEDRNVAAPGEHRYPVVGIVKSEEKGRFYYKVLCGEWTAHGVRVWDEVLKTTGVDFDALKCDKHVFKGFATVAFTKDGKPAKVTSLELSK
jgi:hypothetical protein